jgi:hypothetical protein
MGVFGTVLIVIGVIVGGAIVLALIVAFLSIISDAWSH